ncbi:hypothetical protein PR048_005697 [Dryococelus australis]|uniref:Uncharacterized protein n=1 Tax=Dryococelus australis TaxID=614101 RepID=A0ABQ9I8W9_9NEOP|nr:hypothetical protein PR048_005697 [Dryococelus australis]
MELCNKMVKRRMFIIYKFYKESSNLFDIVDNIAVSHPRSGFSSQHQSYCVFEVVDKYIFPPFILQKPVANYHGVLPSRVKNATVIPCLKTQVVVLRLHLAESRIEHAHNLAQVVMSEPGKRNLFVATSLDLLKSARILMILSPLPSMQGTW